MVVRYPQPESKIDTRQDQMLDLTNHALKITEKEFGPYRMEPSVVFINEDRAMIELKKGRTVIDIAFRPTSIELENEIEPVRIPLNKGLIGYRIFLIHKDDVERFRDCKTLQDLQGFIVGQGKTWQDVPIYEKNNFQVETGGVNQDHGYEGLFEMLVFKRFDLFPRTIIEIWDEHEQRVGKLPDLAIEKYILLHYPFVRYVWVGNSPKGKLLHARLTKGFNKIIANGTFDKIFYKYNQKTIERSNLKGRKLIEMPNPYLPKSVPLDRKELWYLVK